MDLIYKTTVTDLGEKAAEFVAQGMFVIFKDDAPDYLKEFCVIHKENQLLSEIQKGDVLKIQENSFQITDVGSAVNENLKQLGHITFRFDGETNSNMAGSLCLEKASVPKIEIGMQIAVYRK